MAGYLSRTATSELAFQQVNREVDHRRAAVRAGARRLAGFQIVQQGALLILGEHWPALTAARLQTRAMIFASISPISGVSSSSKSSITTRTAAAGSHPREERGHAAHLEGIGTKILDLEAEMAHQGQIVPPADGRQPGSSSSVTGIEQAPGRESPAARSAMNFSNRTRSWAACWSIRYRPSGPSATR